MIILIGCQETSTPAFTGDYIKASEISAKQKMTTLLGPYAAQDVINTQKEANIAWSEQAIDVSIANDTLKNNVIYKLRAEVVEVNGETVTAKQIGSGDGTFKFKDFQNNTILEGGVKKRSKATHSCSSTSG